MKKALALILVLSMILSVFTAVGTTAYAEGTAGTVIVLSQNFETGTVGETMPGWSSGATTQFSITVAQEGNNNKYLKAGHFKADNITKVGKATVDQTASARLSAECIQTRMSDSSKFTYINGKSYNYTWDGVAINGGTYSGASTNSSGFSGFTGGCLWGYDGTTLKTITQWYGQYNTGSAGTTKANVNRTIAGSAWKTFGYTGISYASGNTGLTLNSNIVVNGMFYQWSNPANAIKTILLNTKSYTGFGITDQTNVTFTITDADLYGDEAGLIENGGTFTRAELCKAWDISKDCSPLRSAQRTAALQAALDQADIQIGMDNVLITADAMLYSDTVTAGSHGNITALTNSYTNETTVVSNETKTVTTNDYYGTVYTVTPDTGYAVKEVKLDGSVVSGFNASGGNVTIAPANVSTPHTIEATFEPSLADYTKTNTYTATFKGGTAETNKLTSSDGLTYISNQTASASDVFDATNGFYQWTSNTTRARINFSAFKLAAGRIYKIKLGISNPSASSFSGAYSQWDPGSTATNLTATNFSDCKRPNDTANGLSSSLTGTSISNTNTISTFSTSAYTVNYFSNNSNTAAAGYKNTTYVYTNAGVLQLVEIKNSSTPRIYTASIEETATYHPIAVSVGNGTVASTTNTLNFGSTQKTLSDGEALGVEDKMNATFAVNAPSGYTIKTLTFTPVTGTPVDYSASATGLSSFNVILNVVESAGTLAATYEAKPADIQRTFDYISLSKNVTFYKSIERLASDVIVTGYKLNTTTGSYDATDITGSQFLTFTTDNPLTFDFEAGTKLLKSMGNTGMAKITAVYDNLEGADLTATTMFQRTNYSSTSVYNATEYAYTGMGGHVLGSASCFAWNDAATGGSNYYQLRGYVNLNWKTSNLRSMTGWFYDDGTTACQAYFNWFFKNAYDKVKATSFNIASDTGLKVATDTKYYPNTLATVNRTKGWHQVTVTLDNRGIINEYIDGILVKQSTVTLGTASDADINIAASYAEMRAFNGTTANASIYDDIFITDYPNIKPQYQVAVSAEGGNVTANGTLVQDGSSVNLSVAKGANVTIAFNAKLGFVPQSVTLIDAAGLKSATYNVVDNAVTIPNVSDDMALKANYIKDPNLVEVKKTLLNEDFEADPADSTKTKAGGKIAFGASAVGAWDGVNGLVTYKGGSAANEYRLTYTRADGTPFFTVYPNRTYTYTHSLTSDGTANLYTQMTFSKTMSGGMNFRAVPGSTSITPSTTEIVASHSETRFNDDNVKSVNATNFQWINYSNSATFTLTNFKIEETMYCYPINFNVGSNGSVKYDGADVVGSTNVEFGDRTITITPANGYLIDTATYNDSPVVISDSSGCDVTLAVGSTGTFSVTFKQITVTMPTISHGTPVVAKNYSGTVGETVVTSDNTIVLYGTIDKGYGYTITGCGYYISLNGVNDATPAKLSGIGTEFLGDYGIRAIGKALVAGTYTVTPYITVEGQGEIKGEPHTVTIE